MVERILSYVRRGLNVWVVFCGHPGVFVYPGHESIRRASMACMLPGISAEDCLFTELGIDPSKNGQVWSHRKRKFDNRSSLIFWQIGAIGDPTFNRNGCEVLVANSTEVAICLIPMSIAITFWYSVFSGISRCTATSRYHVLSRLYNLHSQILASFGIGFINPIHNQPFTSFTGTRTQYSAILLESYSSLIKSFRMESGYLVVFLITL